MKLSKEEKAANRAAFKQMNLLKKADYIFTYYKVPIIAVAVPLIFFSHMLYLHFARKEPMLYCGFINVAVGEQLENRLTTDFVESMDVSPNKNIVYTYSDMYLSLDPSAAEHQYAYASRMKLLATIQNQTLDVVLMNREAYDILSANGYLLALPDFLSTDAELAADLATCLTENTVILEDNQIEFDLGTADEYWAETEQVVNGLDVSSFRIFTEAGYSDELYLGVIGNTARPEMVQDYIGYLNMVETR